MAIDVRSAYAAAGPTAVTSSRRHVQATGLKEDIEPGSWIDLVPTGEKPRPLSWLNRKVLLSSRNEFVARIFDQVPDLRRGWAALAADDQMITLPYADFSFLVMGDTGEGDHSQYALVPTLVRDGADAKFLLICSDVIYPGGDVNDYQRKFYQPYATLPLPIYALPGNHDWYDGLDGFMRHLCGQAAPASAQPYPVTGGWLAGRVTWLRRRLAAPLWRPASEPDEQAVTAMMADRLACYPQPVRQPGPYFAIDTPHLRLVGIDPGILGNLDQDQAEWLLRVSSGSKPKLLFSGKPLLVDGGTDPCRLLGGPLTSDGTTFTTVLDVVHHPDFCYVATMAGDIHNYQHYPVRRGDRIVHHVVSGGGGAFMHATHTIPQLVPDQVFGVTEKDFRLYPLRLDSLAAYSRVIDTRWKQSRLGQLAAHLGWRPTFTVSSEEARVYLRATTGYETVPERRDLPLGGASTLAELPARVKRMCRLLMQITHVKAFQRMFSPFLDWDDPPFFKNFLRLDVTAGGVRVTCHAVTGTRTQEDQEIVEDDFTIRWPTAAS